MQMTQKSPWLTKKQAQDQRGWWVVDLEGKTLGRAATRIAQVLRGKHKPTYTPNQDSGDFVIVLNAAKVGFTGDKLRDKMYRRHTGYPGGLQELTASQMLDKKPTDVIRAAVWGMLPKNKLGRRMIKKLKVYPGAEHEHGAQQPRELSL